MDNQIKILLVEDEIIEAMLMKIELNNIGYTVANHVTTGEAAIISAKQNSPDIILMDIRLAGEIDGIEAASVIKSEADIPIIFITCYEDQSMIEKANKIKPLEYLVKPVEMNKLKIIIDNYFV